MNKWQNIWKMFVWEKQNKVGNMKENMWYQSAEIAEKVGNELSFEVTEGQKEYMESHMDEVDEKLEIRLPCLSSICVTKSGVL